MNLEGHKLGLIYQNTYRINQTKARCLSLSHHERVFLVPVAQLVAPVG